MSSWLTDAQVARLEPFFAKSHGKPRVDDRRVLIGIIFINRNGLRWCDTPEEYGPAKTLYNRWKRWGDDGIFARMMHGLEPAVEKGGPDDQKGRLIGRTKGGMNTKLHAVTDADGRPIRDS